jgi:8-oxo-dGTP diphosphatase
LFEVSLTIVTTKRLEETKISGLDLIIHSITNRGEISMQKQIKVVAAIIENEQNEILCALRSPSMSIPNRWEFPGGKVEKDEDIYSALKREILEELGCKVETYNEIFHDHIHEYDEIKVNLICMKCRVVKGYPTAREHSKIIWLKRKNLESIKWAPADVPALNQLMNEN